MADSEALKKAKKKYDKENTFIKPVKLNRKTDQDIINHIKDKAFQTYVKQLIRNDMNKK